MKNSNGRIRIESLKFRDQIFDSHFEPPRFVFLTAETRSFSDRVSASGLLAADLDGLGTRGASLPQDVYGAGLGGRACVLLAGLRESGCRGKNRGCENESRDFRLVVDRVLPGVFGVGD